jgi:hypothetical protein
VEDKKDKQQNTIKLARKPQNNSIPLDKTKTNGTKPYSRGKSTK